MAQFSNSYLLGVKQISSHTHKTGSWYPLRVLDKIFDRHSCAFGMGTFPPRARATLTDAH